MICFLNILSTESNVKTYLLSVLAEKKSEAVTASGNCQTNYKPVGSEQSSGLGMTHEEGEKRKVLKDATHSQLTLSFSL